MKLQLKCGFIICFISLFCILAAKPSQADVPVVEAFQTDINSGSTLKNRVNQLEQKFDNLNMGNLLSQIDNLQQQLQQLRGQLEVTQHDLKLMNEQQRNFYKDLDQRITNISAKKLTPTEQPISQYVPSTIPLASIAAQGSSEPEQEKKAYFVGYELLKKRDYSHAQEVMQQFLQQYPGSEYAVNAAYWIGELFLLQGKLDEAIAQFQSVLKDYPSTSKSADAMLKLGFAYYDKGDLSKAKEALTKVQQQYPKSSNSRLAAGRLHDIAVQQNL